MTEPLEDGPAAAAAAAAEVEAAQAAAGTDDNVAGTSGAGRESSGLALPLARVKKMMRERADVKTISTDANFLVARAAELFLQQLAVRAHSVMLQDEKRKKHDIEYNDIAAVVHSWEPVDFLKAPVPKKMLASAALEQQRQQEQAAQ